MAIQDKLDDLVSAIGRWGVSVQTPIEEITVPLDSIRGIADQALYFNKVNTKLALGAKDSIVKFRVSYNQPQRDQFLNGSDKTDIYDTIGNDYYVWSTTNSSWTKYHSPDNNSNVPSDTFFYDIITNDVWYKSLVGNFSKIITGVI